MEFSREDLRRISFNMQTFICWLGFVSTIKIMNLACKVLGKPPRGGTGGRAVATLAVRRDGKPFEMRPGSHE
jgi:hypothetical protein